MGLGLVVLEYGGAKKWVLRKVPYCIQVFISADRAEMTEATTTVDQPHPNRVDYTP